MKKTCPFFVAAAIALTGTAAVAQDNSYSNYSLEYFYQTDNVDHVGILFGQVDREYETGAFIFAGQLGFLRDITTFGPEIRATMYELTVGYEAAPGVVAGIEFSGLSYVDGPSWQDTALFGQYVSGDTAVAATIVRDNGYPDTYGAVMGEFGVSDSLSMRGMAHYGGGEIQNIHVAADLDAGPTNVSAFFEFDPQDFADYRAFGLRAAFDLGNGVDLRGGYFGIQSGGPQMDYVYVGGGLPCPTA